MKKIALISILAVVICSCSSRSIKPDANEVKLSREAPGKDCHEMGAISGTTVTATGTQDEAVENLKKEAANKGANYVLVKEFSSYGTTVTGIAYECP